MDRCRGRDYLRIGAGALAFTILTSGCQKNSDDTDKNDNVLPQRTAEADGIRWLLPEDPSCINGKSSVDITSATIYQWNGTAIEVKKVPFTGTGDADGAFKSQNVLGSLPNYAQTSVCNQIAGELSCDNDKKVSNDDIKALKICRSDATYVRDSLESVTLTSQYFTEAAYGFYNSILSKKSGLVQSIIIPQPRIKKEITKSDGTKSVQYDADNAAFTDTESDSLGKIGLFLVYPTTVNSFSKSGLNLWEVPFVMSHEFGHHVFHHYLGDASKKVGLNTNENFSLEGIFRSSNSRRTGTMSLTATSEAQFAIDGINETFADLFAYFAGNGVKDQVKGIDCLADSRDPASPVYADGNRKGMNADAIARYEGRMPAAKNKGCATPNFDGEHDIASALGQPIANFIELSFPNSDGKTRAQVLLAWLTKLDKLFLGPKSNIRIDNIVRELVLAVKEKAPLKANACAAFKANITGLPLATAACTP